MCVMNKYLPRSEISPIDRTAPRAPAAVAVVQPVAAQTPTKNRDTAEAIAQSIAAAKSAKVDDQAAGAAEYARVHARIADILADLRSESSATSVGDADGQIGAMLPSPIILVPLPPATKEAVEHAAALAKKMAEQAYFTLGAQAHLKRGMVDQILSAKVA
jgi:hypothetical protein